MGVRERYREKFRYEERLNEFTEIITESAKELFNSNEIYTNLDAETDYLKKILAQTIPTDFQSRDVKLYIVRDPSVNAYCREDGSIFIHIGLLSLIDNEAELAGILSHEFGHYYSKHSLKGYKRIKNTIALNTGFSLLGILGVIPQLITTAKLYSDSRAQEKESDLFAVKFFKQNQYAANAIVSGQEKLYQYKEIYKRRKGYSKSLALFNTHPPSEKRAAYLKADIRYEGLSGGKNFLIDSLLFQQLKNRATDEVIYLDFIQGDYNSVIEKAYLNHLYKSNDDFYTYFLLEALRRKLSCFPITKNQYFITSEFNLTPKKNVRKPEALSIHHQLENVYGWELKTYRSQSLFPDSTLLDPSSIEFVSNAEALAYFTRIAEINCDACYPSLKSLDKPFERPLRNGETTDLEDVIYDQTFFPPGALNGGSNDQCYPVFYNNYYSSVRGKKKFYAASMAENSEFALAISKHSYAEKKEDRCAELNMMPQLNFRDTYLMNGWLNLISQKVLFDNKPKSTKISKDQVFTGGEKVLKCWVNLEADFPELFFIAKKYNFKKIYFADITENGSNPKYRNYAIFGTLVYCLDLSTNTVTRHAYQFMPNSWNEVSGYYGELANTITDVFNKTQK